MSEIYELMRFNLPHLYRQVIDAKTGQEVNEETEAAEDWIDEYEKFRATEADEWVKELTANAHKVFRSNGFCVETFALSFLRVFVWRFGGLTSQLVYTLKGILFAVGD